jgi:hypothetical protein
LLFKRDAGIDSSLPSALGVYPPSPEGIAPPDSAATEELERKALPRMPVPMLASMQPKRAAIQPAAIDRPTGSRGGIYLFWLVIALSAGAIVATFAAR